MNYLDLIIAVPVVLLAISGFRNGFIKEAASLVALILGIYLAVYFSDFVAEWLKETFAMDHRWVFIVAFLLVFIGVVVIVSLIGKLLSKLISMIALGIINRMAGLFFGAMKGIVIMSLLILFLNMIDSKSQLLSKELKEKSMLYSPVEWVAPFLLQNLENINLDDPSWKDFNKSRKKTLDKITDV
jgi:membrane protein required for colicin V production